MMWIKRIQKLWKKLERGHGHQEVTRIEDQIKNNRQIVKRMDADNVRDQLQLCKLQVELMSQSKSKSKQAVTVKKVERKVKQLEERVRKSIALQEELCTWGLGDAVITLTLKCRAMENLIDCAQRLKFLGPDRHVEAELNLLKEIRD